MNSEGVVGPLRAPKRPPWTTEGFHGCPGIVRCPTRWPLYWYLGFWDDHLSQHPDNRETGYSNVLAQGGPLGHKNIPGAFYGPIRREGHICCFTKMVQTTITFSWDDFLCLVHAPSRLPDRFSTRSLLLVQPFVSLSHSLVPQRQKWFHFCLGGSPMGHWGQTTLRTATLRTRLWGQRLWGQTTLRTDDFEDRRLWGQATLRTGENKIHLKFHHFSNSPNYIYSQILAEYI